MFLEINIQELPMTLILIILGVCIAFYIIGYRAYARILDREIINPDDRRPTPAVLMQDNIDFSPARKSILFGHHFASIAGAGPIIGPIVAVGYFGWLATLGWIVIGNIFFGAVHDYLTLMASVRNRGDSIANIAEKTMGKKAKAVFSIFLWAAMVLIVAVFGVVGALTLVKAPQMVIPSFALIAIAILFGWAVYQGGFSLFWGTIIAVGLNLLFIFIGYSHPVKLPEQGILGLTPPIFWFVILMFYAALASILPVHILLQPRDYIATFKLYAVLILGFAGIFIAHPSIKAPIFTSVITKGGPLWPMLFVIVACGAISGFHSLVAGGTTSKQLAKETHGRAIGYGGMLIEGILATITLLLVAGGLFWALPQGLDPSRFSFQTVNQKGWIVTFGTAFGNIVGDALPFIGFAISSMIAMIALKTFILTTLDTATRITRFIVQESLGSRFKLFSNRYIALLCTIAPAFYLGYSNNWKKIWPVFGATNQLVAALALFVISSYLIGVKKPTRYTVIPACFMSVTTVAALLWQSLNSKGFFFGPNPNIFLGVSCLVLVVLAIFVGWEGIKVIIKGETAQEFPAEAEKV
jgi:carbon starvation protein